MIVAPAVVQDASSLRLKTIVNGEVRQDTNTSDLLFGVKALISFLSQGSTLQQGTVIMTGTPGGVALGMKEPKWLVDGQTVEVQIEHLGSCKNRVVFATNSRL
jgi:2-keto-4-pentenoate hydratase/2-oxohepta-3-ene-1,7-dioic acid hydratase in catechol pathway